MFTVTDTALSARYPIYTRANVGEVFPDPVAPATRFPLLWESELGWRDAYIRMGAFDADEFPADEFCILGVAGGYCYLNASVMRLFGERAPGLSWKVIDDQFFGAQPGIPDYVERPGDVRPDLTHEEQVRYVAHGMGDLGTSRDYLANIVAHFTHLGITDAHCSDLLRAVDAYLSALAERESAR